MKIALLFSLILMTAFSAQASQWICAAGGTINVNPYPQSMTVIGQPADTELDAMMNAQMACAGQGLANCQVMGCQEISEEEDQ